MGYSEKIAAWPMGYGGTAGLWRSGNPAAHVNSVQRALDAPYTTWVSGRYRWRDLETSINVYDFSSLDSALAAAQAAGKAFIFYAFDSMAVPSQPAVPNYILNDSQYGGPTPGRYGVIEMRQKIDPRGWILRRWNTNIVARLKALYDALEVYCDTNYTGVLGGIIMDETAANINWVQSDNAWFELNDDPTVTITGPTEFVTAYISGLKSVLTYVHDTTLSSNRNVISHFNDVPFGQGETLFDDMIPWCSVNDIGIGAPDNNPSTPELWKINEQIRTYNRQVPCQMSTQVPIYYNDPVTGLKTRYTQQELGAFMRVGPDAPLQFGASLECHYPAFKANEVAVWPDVLDFMTTNELTDPVSGWAAWSEQGGTYATGKVSVVPANINSGNTITITVIDADLSTSTTVTVDNDVTGERETVTLTETGSGTTRFEGELATQFGVAAGDNEDAIMDCDGGHTFTITYEDANDANGNPANTTTKVTVSAQPVWSQCDVDENQDLTVIAVSSENANVGTNIDDGSLSTFWSPASADSPTVNQWAILDMGASKLMSSVNTTFNKYDLGTTNYKIDYSNQGSLAITNITESGGTLTLTVASHGFSNGEQSTFWNISGMVELNGLQGTVANQTANTFELSDIDGSLFTAWSSGGECQVFSWTPGITNQDSTLSAQWENDDLVETARFVRLYLNSRSDANWLQTFECEVCAVATTGTGTTSTIYTEVDPPLSLEATTLATWQERDLSAYTGITFAIIRRQNTSVSQRNIGVRENGDTTASSQYDMRTVSQDVVIVPVDSGGIIEVYEEVLADSTIDLIGYLTGGTKTARTDKIPSWTSSTWYQVDGSSLTGGDTAVAFLVHIVQTTGRTIGLRPNGSSEGNFEGPFLGSMVTIVGCDGSELFELYQAFAAVARIDILGYFTSADDLTVLTTFEDITPTGLAAYEEKTISTDTAGIVAYISGVTESQDFAIRNADITLDYYYSTQRACSAFAAACSSENKVDVKAENADTNFRVAIKFNRTATTVNPTAVDDIASVATGAASLLIDVLANDYDPEFGAKTITSLTQPSTGTVAVSGGKVLYTPSAGNVDTAHTETFTYKVTSDGARESDAAAIVTVVWNDTPIASNFTTQATSEVETSFDVVALSNSIDTLGQELTVKSVATPDNGTTEIISDLEIIYTSDAAFIGEDTFDVTISDGFVDGDVTVSMTVVVGSTVLSLNGSLIIVPALRATLINN